MNAGGSNPNSAGQGFWALQQGVTRFLDGAVPSLSRPLCFARKSGEPPLAFDLVMQQADLNAKNSWGQGNFYVNHVSFSFDKDAPAAEAWTCTVVISQSAKSAVTPYAKIPAWDPAS